MEDCGTVALTCTTKQLVPLSGGATGLNTGPNNDQPRGVRTESGQPSVPLRTTSSCKASGKLAPISNVTVVASTCGRSTPRK